MKIEVKRCTLCGEKKPLDEFDTFAYREAKSTWCIECCKAKEQKRWQKYNAHYTPKKVEKYIKFKDGTKLPIFVINTLKEFNNCYIRKITFKQEKLEEYVGFKVNYRHPADGIGWVIERKQ